MQSKTSKHNFTIYLYSILMDSYKESLKPQQKDHPFNVYVIKYSELTLCVWQEVCSL